MSYHIDFASRTGWRLDANPLIGLLEKLKEQGVSILDLTESNPTLCGFRYPKEKVVSVLSNPDNMLYVPSAKGMPSARGAVSFYYRKRNVTVDPEHILLTSSTSEAYSLLFRLLVNPGDHVLVPSPSYPLFDLLTDINDVKADHYRLVYGKDWAVDLDSLEKAVTPKTKAVIAVHPNNPTGSFLKDHELQQINRICRKHNLALICDEVFADYRFEGGRVAPAEVTGNSEVLTFVLNGVSKILGLPQMKLGWIAVSGPGPEVRGTVPRLEILMDTYLSVNTPVQNALGVWLDQKHAIHTEIMSRLETNRSVLHSIFPPDSGIRPLNCEGGWYAVLRLPGSVKEERLVEDLLTQRHVFVHPGYFFDFADEPYLVVSLLTRREAFEEGLRRIRDYLQGN